MWEYYIGDMFDGSGKVLVMVWLVILIFVNDMIYIGMLFYWLIVLDFGIGKVKWSFDMYILFKVIM